MSPFSLSPLSHPHVIVITGPRPLFSAHTAEEFDNLRKELVAVVEMQKYMFVAASRSRSVL